jgi:hypothetical protein
VSSICMTDLVNMADQSRKFVSLAIDRGGGARSAQGEGDRHA